MSMQDATAGASHQEAPQKTRGTDPLFEVRNLSVDYLSADGPVRAVANVSLAIRPGEVVGLAGESGSGKSTLALSAARLLPAWTASVQGEVRFQGRDLLALSREELRAIRWRKLAIVFQGAMNSLNPVTTIEHQILDTLRAHGEHEPIKARARARELLDLVEIRHDVLKRYPHELSGGMRQRAVIAIALAFHPDLLLMDEPTTALDVVVQRQILTRLLRLQEALGFAVMFITHDISVLLELCDRIAVMYGGRLVEMAPADVILEQPRHPYTKGLLRSFPSLTGPKTRLSGVPGSPPSLRHLPAGCAFHPRCPLAIDRCRTAVPELREIGTDHLTACHRAEEEQE